MSEGMAEAEKKKKQLMWEKKRMLKWADLMAQYQMITPDEKAKLIARIRKEEMRR